MCLDKDLKGINDRCGHQEGNALIIAAGYVVQRRRSARLRFFLADRRFPGMIDAEKACGQRSGFADRRE